MKSKVGRGGGEFPLLAGKPSGNELSKVSKAIPVTGLGRL
jgi:hypothetical protein